MNQDERIKELEASVKKLRMLYVGECDRAKKKQDELEAEIALLTNNHFTSDFQIFTHDLLLENGVGLTFQGIRKLVYSYRLSEGHTPEWGDESYKTEFKSLKLEDIPNMFDRRKK
jgi:hypothetical protein